MQTFIGPGDILIALFKWCRNNFGHLEKYCCQMYIQGMLASIKRKLCCFLSPNILFLCKITKFSMDEKENDSHKLW